MSLGQAVQRALTVSGVRTQQNLADLLDMNQSSVSKIIRGTTEVPVDRVAEIERACGLPLGQILIWAGFVDRQFLADAGEYAIAATSGAELDAEQAGAVRGAVRQVRKKASK